MNVVHQERGKKPPPLAVGEPSYPLDVLPTNGESSLIYQRDSFEPRTTQKRTAGTSPLLLIWGM